VQHCFDRDFDWVGKRKKALVSKKREDFRQGEC